jgi:DNA polymerase III alpha subunit
MSKIDSSKVGARHIKALAACGCFDSFNISRKSIFLYCSDYRQKLRIWLKKHDPKTETFQYPWVEEPDWSTSELYALEQFFLGESFVCQPYLAHNKFFMTRHNTVNDILTSPDRSIMPCVIAIVRDFFEFKVKKENSKYYGKAMIKATIEDMNGDQCSCTIFPDKWKMVQDRLKQFHTKAKFENGLAIRFSGSTNNYEDNMGIVLDSLYDISMNPNIPSDLEAKKIKSLRTKKEKLEPEIELTNNNIENVVEQVIDQLYDEGLIDLDEPEET